MTDRKRQQVRAAYQLIFVLAALSGALFCFVGILLAVWIVRYGRLLRRRRPKAEPLRDIWFTTDPRRQPTDNDHDDRP